MRTYGWCGSQVGIALDWHLLKISVIRITPHGIGLPRLGVGIPERWNPMELRGSRASISAVPWGSRVSTHIQLCTVVHHKFTKQRRRIWKS